MTKTKALAVIKKPKKPKKEKDGYIYDGKIHSLDDKSAYVIKRFQAYGHSKEDYLQDEKYEFSLKLAEYLLKVDLEFTTKLLARFIDKSKQLNVEFVYQPPNMCDPLLQFFSLAMKFNRLPNDGVFFDA